ncbi:MAG TPA: hypothetical protein VL442_10240 [Mucilaginibacter sp.]|jgi:hypothetical protein|nr:hypothetical protein [Mucilaginibacter sp.]
MKYSNSLKPPKKNELRIFQNQPRRARDFLSDKKTSCSFKNKAEFDYQNLVLAAETSAKIFETKD